MDGEIKYWHKSGTCQAPQFAEPWQGVRDALTEGAICPQLDVHHDFVYVGDEDCLFLNVYTCQVTTAFITHRKG